MKQGLVKLADFIEKNGLTVQACEYDFKTVDWSDAGNGVKLSSRADMLLDGQNGKVILDFKHSISKSKKSEIEENTALQLELYRYLCKKEFGEDINVRVAYVILPEIEIYTADYFKGVESLTVKDRIGKNIIKEAAESYKFRWKQLKENKIERVEGEAEGTGEYAEKQDGLFPLGASAGKYKVNGFDKGYKNLK